MGIVRFISLVAAFALGWASIVNDAAAQVGSAGTGTTVEVCQTPTVTTSNAYGTNYVVGGLLTFPLAFQQNVGGVIHSVNVTIKKVETSGFTLFPLKGATTATTWTDAAVAAINAADVPLVRAPITLTGNSQLGTHTIASGIALGLAFTPNTPALSAVLIANAALTNQFTTAADVQVCVNILQDP